MEVCDTCNRQFKSSETLRKHKNRFHSHPVNVKVHVPYEEMSNAQIAARYLNNQKNKLDGDKLTELKRKIKGLQRFRPKPYDRPYDVSKISDDDQPYPHVKPSEKRDRDEGETPPPKRRRDIKDETLKPTKSKKKCSICFKTFINLSAHMKSHPRCPHCYKKFLNFKTLQKHVRIHRKHITIDKQDSEDEIDAIKEEDPITVIPLPDTEESELDEEMHHPNKIIRRLEDESSIIQDNGKCPICHDSFKNIPLHLMGHPECSRCKKRFIDFPTLRKHIREKHQPISERVREDTSVQCKICSKSFDDQTRLYEHIASEHPDCPICQQKFIDVQSYLNHRKNAHRPTIPPPPQIPPESEDSDTSDDDESNLPPSQSSTESDESVDSLEELKIQDKKSRQHFNCVTVEMFMHVRDLIRKNRFDTLAQTPNLLNALQVIVKGVLEGFIPICSSQRMVLTPQLKSLMHQFSKTTSSEMVLEHQTNLKLLFDILGKSIKVVVDSFNRFGI